MSGSEQSISHPVEADAANTAGSNQASLQSEAYNHSPSRSISQTATPYDALPPLQLVKDHPEHHWYDGIVTVAEGAADEIVHHPLHALESAAIGAGVGLAAVAAAALAPEVATVVGIGGALFGGVELLMNIPKWGSEAAVVADPDHHSAAEVTTAHSDLDALGHSSVDTTLSMVSGGLAFGFGKPMIVQLMGKGAAVTAGAADAAADTFAEAPETMQSPQIPLAPETPLAQTATLEPETPLIPGNPPTQETPPAFSASPQAEAESAEAPPNAESPPPAEASDAAVSSVEPIPVSQAMADKPSVPYEPINPDSWMSGTVEVQRIDRPVVLTTESGRVVTGEQGDLLVTRADGAQAIANAKDFTRMFRPVPIEVSSPMLTYRKMLPVQAEQIPEAFTWQDGDKTMYANAGDWRITQPNGKVSSVTTDILNQTYERAPQLGPNAWLKTALTHAQVLDRDVIVRTLEGPWPAQAGDYLVTGPTGEQYAIPKADFGMYQEVKTS